MVLSKEANAARARAKWAGMTAEERTAYGRKRASRPSRQPEARVGEYRGRFGEDWVPMDERPFVGVDGEGGEWEGRHCYGMLTCGHNVLMNSDGSPLSSTQCLDFLTAQPKYARYVIFYGGYDATFFFRDFPTHVQQQIVDGNVGEDGKRRMVKVGYYWIDYIPRKILKVYRTKDHPDGPGGIVLYDVSAYFQCAFTKALEDWEVGTLQEWAVIRSGKESRRSFTLPCPPDVITYNALEVILLSRLLTKMVQATETLDIRIKSYHGPATLSEALFDKHNLLDYVKPAPPEVDSLYKYAYFGGRFECSAVGIAEEVWEYDIASAYPAAMATLPCQVCGEWRNNDATNAQAKLHLVTWDVTDSGCRFAPFPWRSEKTGALCYPKVGSGWYWGEEVVAAQRAFPECIRILETWSYVTDCSHRPFEWVPGVYAERQRLGKGTAGRVLKLALNSAYGVLARTIGGGGRYANYWWAGQITARTRARLMDLAHAGGASVLMLATDGLYSSVALPVATGSSLGDWEDGGQVGPMLLVQPGVYFSLSPEGKKYRTRGVSLKDIEKTDGVRRLRRAWTEDGPEAMVEVSASFLLNAEDDLPVFIGTKLALAWGKPELIGTWQPMSKTLSFRPEPRRLRAEWEGELLRTVPPSHPIAELGVWSAPYKKMTKDVEVRALMVDQPYLPGLMG